MFFCWQNDINASDIVIFCNNYHAMLTVGEWDGGNHKFDQVKSYDE